MTYREAFTALVDALAEIYFDKSSVHRIIRTTGLPIGHIRISGRADDTWADVLYKARRHNKVEDIFAVALGEYPVQSDLHAAVAAYREVVARGDVPPLPLRRCDFYAHVSLPPNFVARPALLHEVRDMLLATPTMALTSAIPMDALHGMGGIGKSVVARALCDDFDVQDAFPDGILWATIGQPPDLIPRLREWVEELGGIIPQTAPTINQLKQNLAELLTDRACLLILDDVWHRTDAEPFLGGGVRCRLLLTTRDSEVARGLGGAVHPVPGMDPDEAVDLLERWAGGALHEADAALKRQIVRRLGYLPLAIKLAGSQLQRRSPERWLAGFDATQLQERRVEKVHDSLARTLALSLNELTPEVRRLYIALAIFREGEATPMPGIGKLWAGLAGFSEDQTVDLVQDLAARALLQVTDGAPVAVVIHNLLRDFMTAELGEAGRPATHRSLLNAYRQVQGGGDWTTVPDDGYLYDHLVYHLDQLADHDASAVAEMQSLFANDAWLQVRVSGAGYLYDGYLADLDVVWWRAHQETLRQIEAGEEPVAFAQCVRYALIQTSVNSLSRNYEPMLVARAVETGLWTDQRALSVAVGIADPRRCARMLGRILAVDCVSLEVRTIAAQAAVTATLSILFPERRARALTDLASYLSGEEKIYALTQGLAAARDIVDEIDRAEALAALAPLLSEDLLSQGLTAALTIKREESRAEALAALAPWLSADLLTQALAAALAIKSGRHRADVLAVLTPQLLGEEKAYALAQGLAAALAIYHDTYRVGEVDIQSESYPVNALAALTPQLSADLLAQALATALAIQNARFRAQALAALAPWLSEEEKSYALAQGLAALAIQKEGDRARALAALAPQLSADLLAQALAVTLAIQDEWARVEALAALAPWLSADLLTRGLDAALAIKYESYRARVLGALAPQLSADLLAQALATALAIQNEGARVEALAALAPWLSEEEKSSALAHGLAAALAIEYEKDRVDALTALAPHLSECLLAQGLNAALAFQSQSCRAQVLVALAPRLFGDLLAQGLADALAIQDEWARVEALAALAPYLSGDLPPQELDTAVAYQDEENHTPVLAAPAPQFEDKETVLGEIRLATQLLWNDLGYETRENLLFFISSRTELFRPPIFDSDTLSRIANAIVEICEHWTWL